MERELLSVGIDIGTSTTQCVFSSMRLVNAAPAFALPRVELSDKRVLYRAPVRLTPLQGPDAIDAEGVAALIAEDYRSAGISPRSIDVGAVIITGETAHKRNARAVTEALSGFAGDFVVATAGPDLEAVLAGKGSGAAAISRERRSRVLNLDVGGGTSNICLFDAGEVLAMGSMNIGGRLIRRDPRGTVLSISERLLPLVRELGLIVRVGEPLDDGDARRIAERMAQVLEEAVGLRPRTPLHDRMVTEHAMADNLRPDIITFSGGVADCVYGGCAPSAMFDDIGALLGEALARSRFFDAARVLRPRETLHATAIGAGSYSMNVSGSTIAYERAAFPIVGLPVARVPLSERTHIEGLAEATRQARRAVGDPCAIGFEGLAQPSFDDIERTADALADALSDADCPVIVMARDMAKALGQALKRRCGEKPLVCLDGVSLSYGDAIDIGEPMLDGRVLPVVVKTLVF